ncbi:thioredoxin domain-containing protein [Candidatus Peregrinibacteria bacterium]|nr:thioredoxin domain-containing protein [Candidatus Peregrinibacteria bacterium]
MKTNSLILLIATIFLMNGCSNSSDLSPLTMGKDDAPVLIEEFSDIECPACGVISPQVEQIARANSDIVRLEYYHFPLSYHDYAFIGAEAVECAENQGKGWEYLGALFRNQQNLSDEIFDSLASTFKLNESEFKQCLENHEMKSKITSHQRKGSQMGIPGTPTLFINGKMVQWPGKEQLDAYIKSLAY